MKPEISVIIPAYNHAYFIEETIKSVFEQSFQNFELIIINDGSTDNTEKIIQQFTDPRIRYIAQKNSGCHVAINQGISLARGDFITILNSDDVFHPQRLEILLEIAKTDNLQFLITDIQLIDKESKLINEDEHISPHHEMWLRWYRNLKECYQKLDSPAQSILAGNYSITTSNFFIERQFCQYIGLFKHLKFTLDYDYIIRALLKNSKGFRFLIGQKLLYYRLHGNNTILSNPLLANWETFYLLIKYTQAVHGLELNIPLRHLAQIKKYLLKEHNIQRDQEMSDLHIETAYLKQQLSVSQTETEQLNIETTHLISTIEMMKHTVSWKITKPLRWLRTLIIRFKK